MLKLNGKSNPNEVSSVLKVSSRRSSRASFRIRSEDREMVEAIVSSGAFPYSFPCDFFRHAVRDLLEKLSWHEDVDRLLADHRFKAAARQRSGAEHYMLRFELIKERVLQCLSSGKNGLARKFLQQITGIVQNEPRSYWRDRLLQRVRENWGPLLDGEYYPACLRHEKLPKDED